MGKEEGKEYEKKIILYFCRRGFFNGECEMGNEEFPLF